MAINHNKNKSTLLIETENSKMTKCHKNGNSVLNSVCVSRYVYRSIEYLSVMCLKSEFSFMDMDETKVRAYGVGG